MKTILIIALAASLGACGTLGKGSGSEPPSVTIKALADAGCKVTFSVGFGGETGQLGGGLHAENTFSGSCDPSAVVHTIVPLSQATTIPPS